MQNPSPFDPRLVIPCEGASLNSLEGSVDFENVALYAFLCGNCDNTHLVFAAGNSSYQINMVLTPEQSEKLGHLLINPQTENVP